MFSVAKPFVQLWQRASSVTFLLNNYEFRAVVREEVSVKDISYLKV